MGRTRSTCINVAFWTGVEEKERMAGRKAVWKVGRKGEIEGRANGCRIDCLRIGVAR